MSEGPRDGWSKLDIVAKATGSILLPVIILIVGNLYTRQKDEADAAQRNADRVTNLLKHLASENNRERLLAISVVNHLVERKQFPHSLGPAVVKIAATDEDKVVRSEASVAVSQAVRADPQLARSGQRAAESSPEAAAAFARNPRITQTLSEIAESGGAEDKKAASEALEFIRNNNPLDLVGRDGEVITVETTATGTILNVTYSLSGMTSSSGTAESGGYFKFKLDKARGNPNTLVIFLNYSNSSGGAYEIKVTGSGGTSRYRVSQSFSQRSEVVTYTFEVR